MSEEDKHFYGYFEGYIAMEEIMGHLQEQDNSVLKFCAEDILVGDPRVSFLIRRAEGILIENLLIPTQCSIRRTVGNKYETMKQFILLIAETERINMSSYRNTLE